MSARRIITSSFCTKLFLYTLASLVKAKRYSDGRTLIDHRYMTLEYADSQKVRPHSFEKFNQHPESLEEGAPNAAIVVA